MRTEALEINLGPQHPSTHGVLRLICELDGEFVVSAKPDLGFLHRSFEKLAELRTYQNYLPMTDRWDYLSAMTNNMVYVETVEKLMELEAPERAEYLRVIVCELNRIASHLVFVGCMGNDLGAWTPFLYCFRDREMILELFEAICGARLTYSYMRIGGVSGDAPEGWLEGVEKFLDYLPGSLEEIETLLNGNEIFLLRLRNIGNYDIDLALSYGLSGPMLRCTGYKWDLRKEQPFSVYEQLKDCYDIPVGTRGDCLDRYLCRFEEMRESLKIIRECLNRIPDGEIMAKTPRTIKPPAGETYHAIETPRGELGLYLVSDGSEKPSRLKIRGPSFQNLSILPELLPGWKVADMIAILGTTDVVMGEVDR
ncbi:MAG: NADH-quinone oxidoreductase subunit NuoD [Armatimonadetes bacterium CG_4_10_14_3_um_filter_66_18]|nr:NADH-quinone oxidoreductase subunit D [Armatimonadota bacterium]OIO92386.1 MAG: NADH dehydrogenase [Armatimonadetes bacterium CG2_30_66_41]PIU93392.1 MAG: NADH-quinone oxidoreductase subunit NuoD [Armatimonadetes bacterium CG06_land_8_20_14_3_00_66_21]PIX40104.1 MAG: NADH-quinone oxidoreductase subunit NuoD [Armatimonadetes bacterium CG_4_8_14_3_um_filter_66_20]PIY40079.1 MAG: NADH-quinone oxidoreductase subunit NuoD [Armatimonadetes bacterium CG_4_10_14_3_um_filter_66_18]PIZ37586.1 MAG: NA